MLLYQRKKVTKSGFTRYCVNIVEFGVNQLH